MSDKVGKWILFRRILILTRDKWPTCLSEKKTGSKIFCGLLAYLQSRAELIVFLRSSTELRVWQSSAGTDKISRFQLHTNFLVKVVGL